MQTKQDRRADRQPPMSPYGPHPRQGSLPGICWPCSRERYIERWGTEDKAFRPFKADARKAHGKCSDAASRDVQRLRNASYDALMAEACADRSRSKAESRKIAGRSRACDCFVALSAFVCGATVLFSGAPAALRVFRQQTFCGSFEHSYMEPRQQRFYRIRGARGQGSKREGETGT